MNNLTKISKTVGLSFLRRCLSQPTRLSHEFDNARITHGPSTVDHADVEGFARLAHMWWDKEDALKGLHTLNKIRIPFILGTKAKLNENLKILDVGCGGGILSEALASFGNTVTGMDVSRDLLAVAEHHSQNNQELKNKPTYICSSIEEHAKQYKNHYDIVVASEVVEHVNNQELFVKSCVETVKPGGKVIFSCPNKTRLSQVVNIWLYENIYNCPPKGTHQYHKFIRDKDLESMLESCGCKIEETRGIVFEAFTKTWFWFPTTQLFYATRAIKIT